MGNGRASRVCVSMCMYMYACMYAFVCDCVSIIGKSWSRYGLGDFNEWHGNMQVNLKQAVSLRERDAKVCFRQLRKMKMDSYADKFALMRVLNTPLVEAPQIPVLLPGKKNPCFPVVVT